MPETHTLTVKKSGRGGGEAPALLPKRNNQKKKKPNSFPVPLCLVSLGARCPPFTLLFPACGRRITPKPIPPWSLFHNSCSRLVYTLFSWLSAGIRASRREREWVKWKPPRAPPALGVAPPPSESLRSPPQSLDCERLASLKRLRRVAAASSRSLNIYCSLLGVLRCSWRLIIAVFSRRRQSGVDRGAISPMKKHRFGLRLDFTLWKRVTIDGKKKSCLHDGRDDGTNRCAPGVNWPFLAKKSLLIMEVVWRGGPARGKLTWEKVEAASISAASSWWGCCGYQKIQNKSFPDMSAGCVTHCQRYWEIKKCFLATARCHHDDCKLAYAGGEK